MDNLRDLIEDQIQDSKDLIDNPNRSFMEIMDQVLANQCLMFRLFLGFQEKKDEDKINNNETK